MIRHLRKNVSLNLNNIAYYTITNYLVIKKKL